MTNLYSNSKLLKPNPQTNHFNFITLCMINLYYIPYRYLASYMLGLGQKINPKYVDYFFVKETEVVL